MTILMNRRRCSMIRGRVRSRSVIWGCVLYLLSPLYFHISHTHTLIVERATLGVTCVSDSIEAEKYEKWMYVEIMMVH